MCSSVVAVEFQDLNLKNFEKQKHSVVAHECKYFFCFVYLSPMIWWNNEKCIDTVLTKVCITRTTKTSLYLIFTAQTVKCCSVCQMYIEWKEIAKQIMLNNTMSMDYKGKHTLITLLHEHDLVHHPIHSDLPMLHHLTIPVKSGVFVNNPYLIYLLSKSMFVSSILLMGCVTYFELPFPKA